MKEWQIYLKNYKGVDMNIDEVLNELNLNKFLLNMIQNDMIYNEFSFQHELGFYLRDKLTKINSNYRVDFERNIKHFGIDKLKNTSKKEIDIVIYNKIEDITDDKSERYAIELKYPTGRNGVIGRYPKTLKDSDEDIKFMSELSNKFTGTYCIVLVDDDKFYSGKYNEGSKYEEQYRRYRNNNLWNNITGNYRFYIKKIESGKEV